MSKRTEIDWSDHELLISKTDNLLVHQLKIPDSIMLNVKFTNLKDILVVTGDLGHWMFCRPFHPSPDGGVSEMYWLEKLTWKSCQEPTDFDSEATRNEIRERLDEPGLSEELIDYYEMIELYVDEGYDGYYYAHAYGNIPDGLDSDDVPVVRKTKSQLLCVFDAFDEICRRLKEATQ